MVGLAAGCLFILRSNVASSVSELAVKPVVLILIHAMSTSTLDCCWLLLTSLTGQFQSPVESKAGLAATLEAEISGVLPLYG